MTSSCTILFGKHPWSSASNLKNEAPKPRHERNRLKKPAPRAELPFSDELWDLVRSQSYLTVHQDQNNATVGYPRNVELQSRQGFPPPMKANESISLRSQSEMKHEELRRTRAKTPVYRVGQLEEKACFDTWKEVDMAAVFAQQYQDELPSRCFTPFSKAAAQNPHRNSLRRIKCHGSLRDIVKSIPEDDQFSDFTASGSFEHSSPDNAGLFNYDPSQDPLIKHHAKESQLSRSQFLRGFFKRCLSRSDSSDSETLIGSDSETSPNSPALRCLSISDMDPIKLLHDCQISTIEDDLSDSTIAGNDIGMRLCMDLLTNDLATALHQQHPAQSGNRASGLHILLMIEAYETLQQQLRKEMHSSHVTDFSGDHVKAVEGTLDHWLQALRSLYERSLSRNREHLGNSVHA